MRKNQKKALFSLVFLLVYILSLAITYCSVYASESDYMDIKGHWAENQIKDLIDKGYIKGVKVNGQILVQPNRNITRAEFLTILMRTGDYQVNSSSLISFSDVKEKDWFKESIDKAASNQITGGYPDGTFKPNNQISRAEIASLIARIGKFKYDENLSASFKDVPSKRWYYKDVMSAKQNGIIGGYPDGSFKPDGKATRAEVATMISNYLKLNNNNVNPSFVPTPTPKVISEPTAKKPGTLPKTTLPPELVDNPGVDNPKIYGFEINGSNKSEIIYNINHLKLTELGKFSVKISYDPLKIAAVDVYEGSAKGSGYIVNNGSIDLSNAASGEITISSNDSSNMVFTDGTLFIIKFNVLSGATGRSDIKISGISSDKPEMYKPNGDKIDLDVQNGAIVF